MKNPRRTDGSPLFAEYCDAELTRDGMCGRDDAGDAGCCDDADGVNNGAFFARGMITGRSGGDGSTDDLAAVAHESADGAGGVSGDAPPAGSSAGSTVEMGGSAGTGGGSWPPQLGAACPCPCVLELPDGMRERAVGPGEDPSVRTLRTGTDSSGACAAGAMSGVVVAMAVDARVVVPCDVGAGTGTGVGMGNSVWAAS